MNYHIPRGQKLAEWQPSYATSHGNGHAIDATAQQVNGHANGSTSMGIMGSGDQTTHQQTLQQTLGGSITATGVGLHSGEEVTLTLSPAPADTGIVFRRHDLADAKNRQTTAIPAHASNVCDLAYNTSICISDKVRIATIEHLMAALAGANVDNAYIDVAGAELPAFDGSAALFFDMIHKAKIATQATPRKYLKITKPVRVKSGASHLTIAPSADGLRITTEIAFREPFIGTSQYTYTHSPHNFATELAAARTFCLYEDIASMHTKGYGFGGSLDNAIVIRDGCMLNEMPLRYADEFVRHKTLDCLGDLRLLGYPLLGHITAHRPGHRINAKLVKAILADPSVYTLVELKNETHATGIDTSTEAPASTAA
ncbi:MAG: UDP-3-O-acyl-N-acetylglucosamine deacetylase [Proteobacteria bacterium]|nr:UDP-3-O-acyl-N-acetylglucosamine deacetylase [Pseudomonadota bacterium]